MGFTLKRNKTKIFVFFLFVILGLTRTSGQQEYLHSQYMYNMISVNPAYTGSREALSLMLLSRLQWTGLEGAPETLDFSMHAPFDDYKMGLGLSIVADNYGPVDNLYFNLNYAYHVNLSEEVVLSFGLKGGLYQYSEGIGSLDVGERDPAFMEATDQKLYFNAGAGVYLYSSHFYLGGSVPRFMQTQINGKQPPAGSIGELTPHYYFVGGYVFDMGYGFKLKPSFFNRIAEGAPLSTDFSTQVVYEDTYRAGVTYRLNKAVAVMAGVQISPQLMAGYSYDFAFPALRSHVGGSHEVFLSFDFVGFSEKKVVSPRHF